MNNLEKQKENHSKFMSEDSIVEKLKINLNNLKLQQDSVNETLSFIKGMAEGLGFAVENFELKRIDNK